MNTIIEQAANRQVYIDQAQSLNLMITPSLTPKDISNLHIDARRMGVKTLYYQHSINAAQDITRNIKVCTIDCKSCEA